MKKKKIYNNYRHSTKLYLCVKNSAHFCNMIKSLFSDSYNNHTAEPQI